MKIGIALLILFSFCLGCKDPSFQVQGEGSMEAPSLSSLNNDSYFSIVADQDMKSEQVQFSTESYLRALRRASLKLVGRDPSSRELGIVQNDKTKYSEVIQSYLDSEEFISQMRIFFQGNFEMEGMENGVNFDEPTNLALHLISEDKDFRKILTAKECYANDLTPIPCSSFSTTKDQEEQAAGALTTQAFLQKWTSAFNFERTSKAFQLFTCKQYPDTTDAGLEPAQISTAKKEFNCTTCTPACYTCHKSMNSSAALFYNFDRQGMFNRSPSSAVATRTDTGEVSTVADVLVADVTPQYHGKELGSLQDYGRALSESRSFRDCLTQRMVSLVLGSSPEDPVPAPMQIVRDRLSWNGFRVKNLLFEIVTHPSFLKRDEI